MRTCYRYSEAGKPKDGGNGFFDVYCFVQNTIEEPDGRMHWGEPGIACMTFASLEKAQGFMDLVNSVNGGSGLYSNTKPSNWA